MTTTGKRTWRALARIAALAVGAVALAGCATGYDMVQPNVAGSGSYYTSDGPYGGAGYYDDTAGAYYADGGFGSPAYGLGGFGYGYPGFGVDPWLGAGTGFGLGLGSPCGWACAGFYGNPFYAGFGYPLIWGPLGYIGYRHRPYDRPGHRYARGGSQHGHYGWNHAAWSGAQRDPAGRDRAAANDPARHYRNDWSTRQPNGSGTPGTAVEGVVAPADFASRRALPSANFAPHRRSTERAFSVRGAARMSELVGPSALAPGLRDEAAFGHPAAVRMVRPGASGGFQAPDAPAPHGFTMPAVPMMRPMAPPHFSAPSAPAMRAMPSAPVRGARATRVP